jgi:hypothetical protein
MPVPFGSYDSAVNFAARNHRRIDRRPAFGG